MNRKFIINLIFAVGINLLIKPFWVLGVERGVQNAVGAEQYGFYFSLFSFSFLFNVILDFGINNYNSTFIAKHPQLLSKKFSQLVMLKLILVLVYIIITVIVAFGMGYDAAHFQLLMVLCMNQILSFAITYLRSNIAGLQYFITDSLLSVLDRLLMILFCGLLLWGHVFGEMKLEWFVYSQTLSYGITMFVCFLVLKTHLLNLSWKWNKAFTVHLIKKSYPYALLGIFMGFYSKMDGVLIERLLPSGKTEAGHYASAYRLFDAANMIAVLFAGLLLPIFARITQRKEQPNALLQLSFSVIITAALTGASLCYFYNHEIILWLNKTNNTEIEKVLSLLMFSFIFTCTIYIYGTYLTARGELRPLNRIAFTACLLNFTCNILLVKSYGIVGAAWSTLITQVFVAVCHYTMVHKRFNIHFDIPLLWKLMVFTIFQFTLPIFFQNINCHIIVKIVLQLITAVYILLYSNVFSLNQFKKLISR